MPKRAIQKRFDTKEVQGDGSFVIMRSLRVSEIREARKLDKIEFFEKGLNLIESHLIEWNWVGDDDESLPLPNAKNKVIDELTNLEVDFLVQLLVSGDVKN